MMSVSNTTVGPRTLVKRGRKWPAMRRGIASLMVALFFVSFGYCQGFCEDLPAFGVVPLSSPNGMMLLIGGPLLHPSAANANGGWIGYHIYRKSAKDTGFVQITSVPLSRPGSLEELEKLMGGAIKF